MERWSDRPDEALFTFFPVLHADDSTNPFIFLSTGLTILSAVYGAIAILIVALQQDLARPWLPQSSSSDTTLSRWIAVTAIGGLLDLCTMVFPIYLVWGLQMTRESKTKVVLSFLLRAPVIAFSIARVIAISRLNYSDYTFSYTIVEIYTQLELHYSVASTTIPCLQIFLRGFNTNFLGTALEDVDPNAHHEYATAKSGQGSYEMSWVKRSKERDRKQASTGSYIKSLQGNTHGVSQANAQYGKAGKEDAASDNSQQAIVVRREYNVEVQ